MTKSTRFAVCQLRTHSFGSEADAALAGRYAKATHRRVDDVRKISVVHTQRVGVRAGIEDHLRLADEASFDEDAVSVHHPERRHRADLELGIQHRNLGLFREP